MTLKEFSVAHLPLSKGEAKWRKVFPTALRFEEKEVYSFWKMKYRMELQEKWERVHAGEIINTEWRPVHAEFIHWSLKE